MKYILYLIITETFKMMIFIIESTCKHVNENYCLFHRI